jgi:serine/threonine protein kinase
MHSMGVIHRDIKPSNILLNEASDVYVCDFGLARGGIDRFLEATDLTDYVVTRWYRPPELLLMCKYHFPVDVWTVGCVLAECVLQRPLFAGRDYVHQLQLVVQTVDVRSIEFVKESSSAAVPFLTELMQRNRRPISKIDGLSVLQPEGVDLLEKLLLFNPNERITAKEALLHPFFRESSASDALRVYPSPSNFDFSFDLTSDFSECQLRRKIWEEIMQHNHKDVVD